ncbi:MAG: hypothetical protein WCI52_01880 [bacterium]
MHFCPQFERACDVVKCRSFWIRAARQREEALSDTNRYYFRLNEGREPVDDNELIVYYASNGGARDYYLKEHGSADTQGQKI